MIYTVKAGDTLNMISEMFGVPPEKIAWDNGFSQDDILVVGQSLAVEKASQSTVADNNITVSQLSQQRGIPEKTLFRDNFFLNGRQDIPNNSFVVIKYENTPDIEKIIGGYAYDFISTDRLFQTINYLTYIMPFTYGFEGDGNLVVPNDGYIINVAKQSGVKTLMHLSTLTPQGTFDSTLPTVLFGNSDNTDKLINNVIDTVLQKGYDGVDVDFEYLTADERENYVSFLSELSMRLKEIDKILVVALPPKTSDDQRGALYEGIDYGEIGKYADYVLVMTYEWGYRFGPPLAVAPIPSVRRVLDYAVTRIPPEKILLGISNYGYDWMLPFVRGLSDAPSISPLEAVNIARAYNAEILYDESSQAPYFYYTDSEGNIHEVWFEDARSFKAKTDLMLEYSLAGGFIWELMRENPQGYVTLNSLLKIL